MGGQAGVWWMYRDKGRGSGFSKHRAARRYPFGPGRLWRVPLCIPGAVCYSRMRSDDMED